MKYLFDIGGKYYFVIVALIRAKDNLRSTAKLYSSFIYNMQKKL
jgi:hypothetical protein